jgi:type VI secretion system protein ImpJ
VQIDKTLLVGGTMRVLQLEAVMPDGLVVTHGFADGEKAEPLEVDLTPYTDELRHEAWPVHLAVPALTRGATPVKGELARYDSVEGDPVVDANIVENALRIPRLRPRLSLLVTRTVPQKYVSFPLAQIRYENETFSLTDFVPPTFRTTLHSPIGEMCALIAQRLREKAVFLSDKVRSPSVAMRAPLLLETKCMIQSLVAALPPFEVLLATGGAHPYTLYLALGSLMGHVAAVGASLIPPVLPPYDHNDVRAVFQEAKDSLFRALDEGINEAYSAFPFHFEHDIFSLAFEAAWMERRLVLGVRGQAGMAESDVLAWMDECLIGSQRHMQSMRERRILGAARHRIDGDAQLVPARGVLLFALQADAAFIEPRETLQILNIPGQRDAPRPVEILLYVKNTP